MCAQKKATNIVILDLRSLNFITDFFVICSTESDRQSRAIAEDLLFTLKQKEIKCLGSEGFDNGNWVVEDFGDVICHIFLKQTRNFYELEFLWHDAVRLKVKLH